MFSYLLENENFIIPEGQLDKNILQSNYILNTM